MRDNEGDEAHTNPIGVIVAQLSAHSNLSPDALAHGSPNCRSEGVDAQEEGAVSWVGIAGVVIRGLRSSGPDCVGRLWRFWVRMEGSGRGSLMDFVVPGTLAVGLSLAAWLVLPSVLRRLHEFVESGAKVRVLGREYGEAVPFQQSVFGALEDPARLFAGALTFSYLGWLVAPKSLGAQYLSQIRSGLMVLSFMWFLYLYKRNVLLRIVAGKSLSQDDRERYLTMDRLSSIGLLVLGSMAFAESCGVAVQSVITVGGIGGVATAFAARDLLGNLLSGLGIQFSRPFSVGDYITAGDLSGRVVEIGLHSTEMLNRDKFPTVVPNSFFSSQVIVNRSRVRQRGLELNLPVKLTSLEKLPTITSEVRSMLHSHPKVSLENEKPRCHVSQVGATSFNVAISCNLKPMSWDDFLVVKEEILLEASRIVVRSDPEPDSEKSFSDGAEMVEKPVVDSSPESDDLPAQADEKPGNTPGVSVETSSPAVQAPVSQEAWTSSEHPAISLAHRPSSMARAGENPKGPESPRNRHVGQPEPSPRSRYGSNSQPDSPRKGGPSSILGVGSKLLSRIKNSKR